MITKVIRVDWETYKIINDYANKININIGDATRLLVERGLAAGEDKLCKERNALKAQLDALRQGLREIVAEDYGEHILEDMRDDEDVLLAVKNLCSIIEARDNELARYREMFPCVVCGKPMKWRPDDNLGQALQKFVREGRWGHPSCWKSGKQ